MFRAATTPLLVFWTLVINVVVAMDYYATLGVPRNADSNVVRTLFAPSTIKLHSQHLSYCTH